MNIFNKVLKKLNIKYFIGRISLLVLLTSFLVTDFSAQIPSYSAWHFKDGNLTATKRPNPGYKIQTIDSFLVKWTTPYISGDISPLIGNIKANNFQGVSDSEPLEICALMGDEIILVSGSGKLLKKQKLPSFALNVKSFTSLFDSSDVTFNDYSRNTVLIGSESIEFFNPNSKDSLAHSYIFGYDAEMDSIKVVKRLSIDLKEFKPNVSASIKPFYGRRVNGRLMVYAMVDMQKPLLTGINNVYPYFRGFAQFYDDDQNAVFPLPDMKDIKKSRIHVTGDISLYQPSVKLLANNYAGVLFPYQRIDTKNDSVFRGFSIRETDRKSVV